MKTLLILGGSGFVGKSIINSFLENHLIKFKIDKLIILSRNAHYLKKEFKVKGNKKIVFKNIDLFNSKKLPDCNYVIHAAEKTLASATNKKIFSKYFNLTKKICDYFKTFKNIKFLYLSSGAVYGKINKKQKLKETAPLNYNNLTDIKKEYAKYKIKSENYLKENFGKNKLIIARLFSFTGHYLAKNKNYAVGNFFNDVEKSRKIKIKSTNPNYIYRSYLDSEDLVEFLMHLIVKKNKTNNNIFNIGSDKAISIMQLAKKISKITNTNIFFNKKSASKMIDYYVPNIDKIKKNYQIKNVIKLENSLSKILKTIKKNKVN
jgi:nucleoside-diphosphate-sugar epimerase